MLLIICGLPGTGKSTLARAVAAKLGAVHISSDSIRLKLLAQRTYSEQEKKMIYDKMFEEATEQLQRGNVVLDATFYTEQLRQQAKDAAAKACSNWLIIECMTHEQLLKERVFARKQQASESEADFEIYKKVKGQFEEIKEMHLDVDTSLQLEKQVELVRAYLESQPEYIETHISKIYILGDYVYKIKKPVKFSFLDFSTLELRKFYCQEEVRLNKRLCPDIYLDVVAAEKQGERYIFETKKADEYAVKMKKMPAAKQMDLLLQKGTVTAEQVRKIAEIVAEFHKRIVVVKELEFGAPELIKKQVDDFANHRETIEKAVGLGHLVDFGLKKCDDFYGKNTALFERRQQQGFIRECHGDLHSANIILAEKIYIFDCIEFNPHFRNIDVASEIAFMAMDLDAFGRSDLADAFVQQYVALSGDKELLKLLDYYKCYRANVRAKVAAIEYAQHPNDNAKKRMEKYCKLMEQYAKRL
ncbi:MAG: AAA family ATPase [Candidatus Micrarchaeota archaeon]